VNSTKVVKSVAPGKGKLTTVQNGTACPFRSGGRSESQNLLRAKNSRKHCHFPAADPPTGWQVHGEVCTEVCKVAPDSYREAHSCWQML